MDIDTETEEQPYPRKIVEDEEAELVKAIRKVERLKSLINFIKVPER